MNEHLFIICISLAHTVQHYGIRVSWKLNHSILHEQIYQAFVEVTQ